MRLKFQYTKFFSPSFLAIFARFVRTKEFISLFIVITASLQIFLCYSSAHAILILLSLPFVLGFQRRRVVRLYLDVVSAFFSASIFKHWHFSLFFCLFLGIIVRKGHGMALTLH